MPRRLCAVTFIGLDFYAPRLFGTRGKKKFIQKFFFLQKKSIFFTNKYFFRKKFFSKHVFMFQITLFFNKKSKFFNFFFQKCCFLSNKSFFSKKKGFSNKEVLL